MSDLAPHVIEMIDGTQSSNEEVRALTAKWVAYHYPSGYATRPQYGDCGDIGDEIEQYVRRWYGMLAHDETSFPGSLLARLLGLVDWQEVGRYYLTVHVENDKRAK